MSDDDVIIIRRRMTLTRTSLTKQERLRLHLINAVEPASKDEPLGFIDALKVAKIVFRALRRS